MKKIEITPNELQNLITYENNIILLDVRTYKEAKIATLGGIHIPLNELLYRISELNQKNHIIVYCHHGIRSFSALKILNAYGFNNVQHLKGGIDAWSDIIDFNIKKY